MDDESYFYIFEKIVSEKIKIFQPNVCVVCCGADSLSGDALGKFNLTEESYVSCVSMVMKQCKEMNSKLLILGGGGYNIVNTSKLFTKLTSILVEEDISNEIPESEKYFEMYEPEFQLNIKKGKDKNLNTKEELDKIISFF
jgi:acetoin utilization deacetylase AcuC-like enzyme